MAIQLPSASPASGGTGAPRRRRDRLPDAGSVPRVAPTRDPGLVVPDFGAEARALGELGSAIEGVALRAQAAEEAEQRRAEAARNRLENSRADTDFLTAKTALEVALETDTEFGTQVQRYGETLAPEAQKFAAGITDLDARQLYLDRRAQDIVVGAASLSGRVRVRQGDASVAELNERLVSLREQALLAKDAAARAALVDTAIDSIRAVEARGYIDAATSQRVEQNFVEDLAKGFLTTLPPERRIELLTGKPEGVVEDIPADDRAALRRQAEREVETLEREAEREAVAASADFASELEIRVSRGQAGEAEVRQAHEDGRISASRQTELVRLADRVAKAEADVQKGVARVDMALTGAVFLDPRNAKDRKAANDYFERAVLPAVAEARAAAVAEAAAGRAPAPVNGLAIALRFAEQSGLVPDALKGQIRGGLRTGGVAAKAQAADVLDRLVTRNPKLLDEFAQADVQLALSISENVRAGMGAQQAVELAEKAAEPTKEGEREVRRRRINEEGIRKSNASFLDSELTSGRLGRFFGSDNPDDVPDALRADFDALFDQQFLVTGDRDAARAMSLATVRAVWGITTIGGRRWQKFAPEAVYLLNAEDDGEWMGEQLRAELAGRGLDIPEDDIRLEVTPDTARQSAPSYLVMRKLESGAFEPVLVDDAPLFWRPDWNASPEAQRRVAEFKKDSRRALEKAQAMRDFLDPRK